MTGFYSDVRKTELSIFICNPGCSNFDNQIRKRVMRDQINHENKCPFFHLKALYRLKFLQGSKLHKGSLSSFFLSRKSYGSFSKINIFGRFFCFFFSWNYFFILSMMFVRG